MLDKNRADNYKYVVERLKTEELIEKIERLMEEKIPEDSRFDESLNSNQIWILGEEVVRRLMARDYEYIDVEDECIILHNTEVHVDYLQTFGDDNSIRLMSDLTQGLN